MRLLKQGYALAAGLTTLTVTPQWWESTAVFHSKAHDPWPDRYMAVLVRASCTAMFSAATGATWPAAAVYRLTDDARSRAAQNSMS